MRVDPTVKRAARSGARTLEPEARTRTLPLCRTCWARHEPSKRLSGVCPGIIESPVTEAEMAEIIAAARTRRTEEDIAAYAARRAA